MVYLDSKRFRNDRRCGLILSTVNNMIIALWFRRVFGGCLYGTRGSILILALPGAAQLSLLCSLNLTSFASSTPHALPRKFFQCCTHATSAFHMYTFPSNKAIRHTFILLSTLTFLSIWLRAVPKYCTYF